MKSASLFTIAVAILVIAACADTAPIRNIEPDVQEEPQEDSPTGFVQGFETEFIDEEHFIEIGEMV